MVYKIASSAIPLGQCQFRAQFTLTGGRISLSVLQLAMSQRNKRVKSPDSASPNIQVKRALAKDSESPNEDENVPCSSQTDAEEEKKGFARIVILLAS